MTIDERTGARIVTLPCGCVLKDTGPGDTWQAHTYCAKGAELRARAATVWMRGEDPEAYIARAERAGLPLKRHLGLVQTTTGWTEREEGHATR